MSKNLEDIANALKANNKKVQLIYAFNGTGKTRLSKAFKHLIAPKKFDDDESIEIARNKILYYNAFTEDLFYWNNDLNMDRELKLIIQRNTFTDWVLKEQGQDQNITTHFQRYTNNQLTPKFNEDFSEVTFSFARGNDEIEENIKISKGEESNFVWCVFYALLEQVISELNISEEENRSTQDFNKLEYIFIDDPVSSLDDNHLIELAMDLTKVIKESQSSLKFIITTHNPLFYNVLWNNFSKADRFLLEKIEGNPDSYSLMNQDNDSPFSYHLHLKMELEKAIQTGQVKKYHFNLLRNLLEKTATFLGYKKWGDLLPKDPDGSNPTEIRLNRMIGLYSHSSISSEESVVIHPEEASILKYLIEHLNTTFGFRNIHINEIKEN